ncbi:MAG: MFS transporter [Chitinivibrionia bacterium]|nr:MFS transporter [Chitinivibrionia bacterium]
MNKPKLWTQDYVFACIGNLLGYFGFCMVLPVLPMFLIENYSIPQSKTGIILASFTFSAMLSRPIFAYLADIYNRKKIYCAVLLIFAILFLPYPLITGGVVFFVILRSLHGFAFGGQSVCGNAILVDIVNEKRRGEGFGYFGISNNIGMALGPMTGIYIYETGESGFFWMFVVAFILGIAGFMSVLKVRLPKNTTAINIPEDKKISFDKFFQIQGIYAGISLMLLSFPYGLIVSFSALYGKELGIGAHSSLFFVFMSLGLVFSRLFAGKVIDGGGLTIAIKISAFFISITLALFASIDLLKVENVAAIKTLFYTVGLFLGLGYGALFPSFNTLFVNLSPDNRRAAASSTYMTNWDLGLGAGLIFGGVIMEKTGMSAAYLTSAVTSFVAALYFTLFAAGHFERHKLR